MKMTNKEAIKILSNHFFSVGYSRDGKIRNEKDEALLMAIKALENSSWIPVKTKKLSPEEIREFCEKTHEFSPEEIDGAWRYDCKLPEETQDVLITTRYEDVVITKFVVDSCEWYFEDFEDEGDLLAWMPLPEPYKKEEE